MNNAILYRYSFVKKNIIKLKSIRRKLYGLRQFIPILREIHQLEAMVGPLGFWDNIQKYQYSFLTSMGMNPNHKLLDVGCGPLMGGLAFIKYLDKKNYYGFDIDEERIQTARTLVKKHQLVDKKPVLFVADDFGRKRLSQTKFDFIWASQILYYFNHMKIKKLFQQISRVLKENGKFYCDIIGEGNNTRADNTWGYQLHTIENLNACAEEFGLRGRYIGQIQDFGYPKVLTLKTNNMLEFTHI